MKSVLVIETPPCCEDCPCSTIVKAPQIGCWSANCEACGKFNDMIMTKPEWCPLKPMPTQLDTDHCELLSELDWRTGWNACLEEIER